MDSEQLIIVQNGKTTNAIINLVNIFFNKKFQIFTYLQVFYKYWLDLDI